MAEHVFDELNEDYGDLMTAEEFIDTVEVGGFIPYDGDGYWSNGTHHSHELSVWDDNNKLSKRPQGATHVIWFNR